MKRSEIEEKIQRGIQIDEENVTVLIGKKSATATLCGANYDLETGKVTLKYAIPATPRGSKELTAKSRKGGK